jgi:hypothetical protein
MLLASMAAFVDAGSAPLNTERAVWSCLSNPNDDTIYMSGVFESRAPAGGLGNGGAIGVDTAFTQMLATRYGVKTWAACAMAQPGPNVLAKAQSDQKSYAAQLARQGKKVIETGWAYGGGTTPTPPSTAPSGATQPAGTAAQAAGAVTSSSAPTSVDAATPAVGNAGSPTSGGAPQSAVSTVAKPTSAVAPAVATASSPSAADHPAVLPRPAPPTAPARPAAPKEVAYVCQTGHYAPPPNRHFTRYQSGVVHTTNDLKSVTTAWRNYLISTYHLTGQVGGTCLEAGPSTDAILAGWAQQRSGQQVEDVKVDWHG